MSSSEKEKLSPSPSRKKRTPCSFFPALSIVCLVALCVISLITYYFFSFLEKEIQHLSHKTQMQSQTMKTLRDTINDRINAVSNNASLTLSPSGNTATNAQDNLTHNAAKDSLYLARYAVMLASLHNTAGDNKKVTIGLLSDAQTLLSPLSNPLIEPIRLAITAHISALEAQPLIDTTGILSALQAAQKNINILPLKPHFQPETCNPPKESPTTTGVFEKIKTYVSATLSQFVTIKHQDSNSTTVFASAIYDDTVRERIGLALQGAEIALLQSNQQRYHFYLNAVIHSLQATGDNQQAATQTLMRDLTALANTPITNEPISFDEIMGLINNAIKQSEETAP